MDAPTPLPISFLFLVFHSDCDKRELFYELFTAERMTMEG